MTFDLHTTHRLIALLENGKMQTEKLFDQLPIFFIFINEAGLVVRANQSFCQFSGQTEERMLNSPMSMWLDPVARVELEQALINNEDREFVTVSKGRNGEKSIRWMIHGFLSLSGEYLYCAIGKTLDGGKEYRERLEQLMVNLPQGLLRVTGTGYCTQEYSMRLVEMLGRAPEYGESIKEYFGSRLLYSSVDLECGHIGVQAKIRPYGSSQPMWVEWTLLDDSYSLAETNSQYFSLVAVQSPPSSKVFIDSENESKRTGVQLEELFKELDALYALMSEVKDSKIMLSLLHSFKSCARIAALNDLVKKVHLLEEKILGGASLKDVFKQLSEVFHKTKFWGLDAIEKQNQNVEVDKPRSNESVTLLKSQSLKFWTNREAPDYFNLSILKLEWIDFFDSCRSLAPIPLDFQIELPSSYLPKSFKPILDRILLQLLQNSVSHGYESMLQRKISGKSYSGKITLKVYENEGGLLWRYSDDGEGFNYEKIRRNLVEKVGEEANKWPKKKILEYVKKVGVSQKSDSDEMSGHGIGLPSIYHWAEKIGAEVEVNSSAQGCSVDLYFHLAQNQHSIPSWYPFGELQEIIASELNIYLKGYGFEDICQKIEVENLDPITDANVLLDPSVVVFIIAEWCLQAGKDNFEGISFAMGESCLKVNLTGNFKSVEFKDYMRYMIYRMMKVNKALVYEVDNGLIFEFGYLV